MMPATRISAAEIIEAERHFGETALDARKTNRWQLSTLCFQIAGRVVTSYEDHLASILADSMELAHRWAIENFFAPSSERLSVSRLLTPYSLSNGKGL
jgi:hypothetical protein